MLCVVHYYRPRSEASEGYVFTGVCHSFCSTGGGGGGVATPKASGQHPPWDQVTNTHLPPPTWSQHPPPSPLGHGHKTPSLPWDQLDNTPLPPGMVTTPPPPQTWSQHQRSLDITPPPPPPGPGGQHPLPPPGPGGQHPPPPDMVTTPPSLPPDMVTTPPSLPLGPGGQHTTTPPPPRHGHNTPALPRDYAQAGGTHPTGMHSCLKLDF